MDGRETQPVTIEPRTVIWAIAEVSWEDNDGVYKVRGTLEDTSRSGACVRVKRPFTIGSRVTIKWQREQFSAITRNCRRDGYDFLLGVKREPPNQILSAHTRPQKPSEASATDPSLLPQTQSKPTLSLPATTVSRSANTAREKRQASTLPPPRRSGRTGDYARSQLDSYHHHLSARQERTDMQPKRLFPQFWRRQQGGDVPEKPMPKEAPVNKATTTAEPARGPQSELLSYDDIYRAAGIMNSRSGYGIHKVVDMLNSDRIRDLPPDVKRASVLMALDAAGTSSADLLNDALRRQSALDSYEAAQRKQVEEFEASKNAENGRIEAELEKIRIHYAERMQANHDLVTREKESLRNWQMAMQHESQRIHEVIELCGERPASKTHAAAAATGSVVSDTGQRSS